MKQNGGCQSEGLLGRFPSRDGLQMIWLKARGRSPVLVRVHRENQRTARARKIDNESPRMHAAFPPRLPLMAHYSNTILASPFISAALPASRGPRAFKLYPRVSNAPSSS